VIKIIFLLTFFIYVLKQILFGFVSKFDMFEFLYYFSREPDGFEIRKEQCYISRKITSRIL